MLQLFNMKAIIYFLLIFEVYCAVHHHPHPQKILGLKYNLTEACFQGITCDDDEYVFGFVMDYYGNHGNCPDDFELTGHGFESVVRHELDEDICLDTGVI